MKNLICLFFILFFVSCSNSNFTYMPLPNFKAQVKESGADLTASVELKDIQIQRVSEYSNEFESSVLKIRIDEEIELLKERLKSQSEAILRTKGYKVVKNNADYEFSNTLSIIIKESNIQKNKELLSGEAINSDLNISFHSEMLLRNKTNSAHTKISSQTSLQDPINISYPFQNDQGVQMFKTTISSVATQINKSLEHEVFEIDKIFISFYKNSLTTLYHNLKSHDNANEDSQIPYDDGQIDSTIHEDGVIIFE
ncbi:hypothetical protein DMB92_04745 [Campylobacter sp. MIT 99-7217]|uniref:hypothetical protein n=1 Tax=Campylobacter sp. MIT 99-7217 TaxID=535091 RepID=UPI0011585CA7|nr:hypothetical protein [Campylobacter sp. MIT 99-7217]TQR32409.1 hypothetical protein DMB92_04745 [Campylobacter sp. MIT 99-7217]